MLLIALHCRPQGTAIPAGRYPGRSVRGRQVTVRSLLAVLDKRRMGRVAGPCFPFLTTSADSALSDLSFAAADV